MEDPEAFDYSSYFARMEELEFRTEDYYEKDLHDPRWIWVDSAGAAIARGPICSDVAHSPCR
jgi:hypothetical protein